MRESDEVLKDKWRRLLRYRRFFRHIPFIEFVLVAGSMALGTVDEHSDLDVIVEARNGRIFTVRFLCVALFGLLRVRRRGVDHGEKASNKLCFNHFVTPAKYTLSPPYNAYWIKLYQNLVPLFGKRNEIGRFFKANDWAKPGKINDDERWLQRDTSRIKKFLEKILTGKAGNSFEHFVKQYQVKRIKRGVERGALGFEPRLRYDDTELEFHVDTKRIKEMLEQGEL